jgi:alpha-tubulin suppressor-like RCC1 family protein
MAVIGIGGWITLGQLGNGNTTNSAVPVKVSAGTTRVIRAVEGGNTANDGQTIVFLSSGKIRGWGSNAWDQLCNGFTANKVTSPIRIFAPGGTKWVSFASGGSTSYGLDSSGNLWSCGANSEGEAGVGTESTDQVVPAKILPNVLDVSATSRNVLALSH